ncbi:MAG: MBOAT family protein, partial [Spirochaetia bacterium]|nr:MBOAT family protein [Spirochaetia bacterium]
MSFVDPFFFIFLIIAFTGFHFLNETGRKSVGISFSASGFLLILSLFFYGYFKPVYLFLLIGSSLAAWFAAGLMDGIFLKKRFLSIDGSARKWILAAAVTGLLFPLFFFKYSNFALSNLQISGIFENAKPVHFLLPLGISFFTFQNISYITDVYRKMIPAEKNPFKYGLYISFFPQLVAGPIVTARSFLPQLEIRKKFSDLDLRLAAFYL